MLASLRREGAVSFHLEEVPVARSARYRAVTRVELYVLAGRLAPAGLSAARACRAHVAGVALAPTERLAAISPLLRRLNENSRRAAWATAETVAALGRVRWVERVALPVAVVMLAGVAGAAMPTLIAGKTPEGVAMEVPEPVSASELSWEIVASDRQQVASHAPARGRATEPARESAPVGDAAATPISTRGDESSEAQAQSSTVEASEPSPGVAPQTSPRPEPDAQEPTAGPTPAPPVDEEPEEEETEESATICHKAGSKNPKTLDVTGGAVEEHLAHGDTIGACP